MNEFVRLESSTFLLKLTLITGASVRSLLLNLTKTAGVWYYDLAERINECVFVGGLYKLL